MDQTARGWIIPEPVQARLISPAKGLRPSSAAMAKALAPEASAGSSGPKFSSRLMQMKFMQRGKPVRTLAAEEEAAQVCSPSS